MKPKAVLKKRKKAQEKFNQEVAGLNDAELGEKFRKDFMKVLNSPLFEDDFTD